MKRSQWLATLAQNATPHLDECIEYLGSTCAWLHDFKRTPQDEEWHAEGNVYIHTQRVLAELYKVLATDAVHITGVRRQALILGAILHDIAKPMQTRVAVLHGKTRVIAPQHESVGRSYLAPRLMELELPFDVIWQVLHLVGEHHMPKTLALKESAASDFYRLARQVDTELLYWLEVADMRGRICPDLDWQLLCLDEFKAQAQALNVWGQSTRLRTLIASHLMTLSPPAQRYVYAYGLALMENGSVTQLEEVLGKTYSHRECYAHLVMTVGLSGSGKSTWLARHYPDYEVISLDDLREEINGKRSSQKQFGQIIQTAKARLKAALREHRGVVWDATNLRMELRAQILDLARDYHALITMAVFMLPLKTIWQQNNEREYCLPNSVLQRQIEQWQLPTLSEAHHYQVIGEEGKLLYESGNWSTL